MAWKYGNTKVGLKSGIVKYDPGRVWGFSSPSWYTRVISTEWLTKNLDLIMAYGLICYDSG